LALRDQPLEARLTVKHAPPGMVLAWEPIFSVDGQGFYLEDMVLITPSGAEVLTKGLPYASEEIENAMRR
jgi:Xaa-Pro aminopeptidase